MAPRATFRRRSRERNPDVPEGRVNSNLINFEKPNLPPLQGTPSSRRQYSYGSGVEPLPARPVRRGKPVDLASAVKGALTGQGDEDEVFIDRTEELQQTSYLDDDEEDELAGSEADYRPSLLGEDQETERISSHALKKLESLGQLPDPPGWRADESEADDARSFDMESDYYDGATIDSVAGDIPPPPPPPPLSAPPVTLEPPPRRHLDHDDEPAHVLPPKKIPIDSGADITEHEEDFGGTMLDQNMQQFLPEPTYEDITPVAPAPKSSRPGAKSIISREDIVALATPPETDSQLSLEVEATKRPTETLLERLRTSSDRVFRGKPVLPEREKSTLPEKTKTIAPLENDHRHTSRTQHNDSRKSLKIPFDPNGAGLFSRTEERTSAIRAVPGASRFPSDRSEMDDAMQSDIYQAEEEEAEENEDEEDAHHHMRADLRHRQDSPKSDSWYEQDDDDDEIDWWQLFNPFRYIQAAWWSFQSILDSFLDTFSRNLATPLQDYMASLGINLLYLIAGILALLIALAITSFSLNHMPDFASAPSNFPISLPSFGGVADGIGRYIPSFGWPSGDVWDDFPSLGSSGDSRLQKMEDWLKDLRRELGKAKKSGQLHDASIKKLEHVVPKLVHMTLKDGKPIIAQEFWHAIRDLIHQDDNFLTLEKKGSEYDFANQKQWKSIVSRLTKDPAFSKQVNLSVGKLEDRLADKLPAFWETWVAGNERKISQMVGTALDKMKLPGTPKELEARLNDLVKKHLGNQKTGGVVVTRDEFLRHLKNEFTAHRAEIKAEIGELQPKFEKLVKESIALAKGELPDGMAKAEVEKLVKTLVSKSLADMNLEALAKGRIHAHWDKDLKNRVNYFGVGAGAVIDPNLSSGTYQPNTEDINRKGLRASDPLPPIAAILPWLDDGDCWCGTRRKNGRGNPHDVVLSVMMGHSIIPQHVVVEHILPGATTDPGARPKDIEVYATIEDPTIRGRVRDFAAAHFPDDKDNWNFAPANLPYTFVKIGQFVYEGAELHDGVHVHHLSPELIALGAETDQVVIRATSNYGAKWHTCFYRVRLFGHRVDEMPPASPQSKQSRWYKWGKS
ncbi:hypothetical protein PT974_09601 [Cladobotryum mycophilum]|uniref:SUN domain-containing protein n=1 Tax=Cladobotryum mycophilum TaxID=491253 RepID=A0ABR0SHT6_9HYPO